MATKFEEGGGSMGESFLRSRFGGASSSPRHKANASTPPSLSSLLSGNLRQISLPVQRHLISVYTTLLLAVACAAGGAFFDSQVWQIGGVLTTLGALAIMAALAMTPASPATLQKRQGLLCLFSALQGASLGPLLNLAFFVDPSLVAVAFGGAAAVFASFSLAALLTRRRAMLALTGILSTAITSFLWLHLAAMFLPRSAAFMLRALQLELYLGVFVFAGYVLVDTQVIVEKAYAGDTDHVAHALDLFVDLVALFARLLAILVRNAAARGGGEDSEEGRREREQRRRGQQSGVSAARGGRRF
jgi:FtsH-binding integral membrane protein